MGHHGVVDQGDAEAFAILEAQRFGIGELDPVKGPGELLHVASEVQFDGAAGLAAIRIHESASEIGIGEYAAAIVA
ncbi:hypothetical protein FQZ97_1072970 [compost metagenome]